ncbi:MAG: branched-chain amino acid ABC transporter permease [Syntrophaceae bacterium]|nr:branched-chain amino acid ABC transporter permease [Syntrophaceae bacterium]
MNEKKTSSLNPPSKEELPSTLTNFQRKEYRKIDFLLIAAGFLLITPILSVHRVTDFMIFCIFAMSFDLLYGYMGRLSFGHMLFLGTGAYSCGLFIKYVSGNPLIAILVGIAVAGLLGILLGLIIVRTTGACFALINLAFNHIGFFLVLSPLREITRGEDGFGVSASKLGFLNFSSRPIMFGSVLLCLLLVFYLLKRLTSSPFGIMIRSIKEDETRVRFLGYNTFLYKWITFVLAGSLAGLAGTLSALNYNYVNPNSMDVHSNVGVVFACLIGGAGNLYGALVGGVVYMVISNFLPIYIHRWEMFLGFSLLIITFRFRKGICGYLLGLWEHGAKKRLIERSAEQGVAKI